jgi:dihydrolipoamide dehydrogenase
VGEGRKIEGTDADGKVFTLQATNTLICTGCVSRDLPGLPFNGKLVISSYHAMVLEKQPKSMIIISAGA